MFKRIIVPLDGSPLSEQALARAKDLSTAMHAPLVLLRVVDTASITRIASVGTGAGMDYSMVGDVLAEEQEDAKAYLEAIVTQVKNEGFEITGKVQQGPIANTIVDSADPEDVIVIASHGRSGVQRWFLGSVAEDVVRRANCPVLLIREKQDASDK